ncbi:MAG TPA: septum formation initiator family protein [Candidatus Omnitrophota bacterium]|nr:septum formation initiator family protein [Candidatus Omnitrophota bacterium]
MNHLFRRFLWPIVLVLAISVIFLPGFAKIHRLNAKNNDLVRKNKRLQTENELLRSELSRVEKDRVYQEKILREKLGVVRKDEVPVKIIPDVNN